ncbi:MAG: hypothetical protein EBS05_13575 [Proteobacteria bacterium]|jgi:hypothetical protein|nr:hypothetical protein [Pseudomonadota bacterium]
MNLERILVNTGWVALMLAALLLLSFIPEPFLHARAKPPAQVTNAVTFLEWKPMPTTVFRLAAGANMYWQVTGPAGRFLASGPSAYSFDSNGRLIGWTPDMGDVYQPRELFGSDVKRERATLEEFRATTQLVRQ